MTGYEPRAIEIPRRLEPVTADSFINTMGDGTSPASAPPVAAPAPRKRRIVRVRGRLRIRVRRRGRVR
jgi:hypothetical protein